MGMHAPPAPPTRRKELLCENSVANNMLRRGHTEKEKAATTEASVNTMAVQKNWAERDFVQGVQVGVAQLTAFLNDFGRLASRISLDCSLFVSSLLSSSHSPVARLISLPFSPMHRGYHALEARCSGWKALQA